MEKFGFIDFYRMRTRENAPLIYAYNQQRQIINDDIFADKIGSIMTHDVIEDISIKIEKEIMN